MLQRWNGPHPEYGYRHFHSYEQPFPEFPALTHVNEAVCLASHVLEPHHHSAWELCCFVGGRAEWEVGGARFPVAAGDVFVSRPGELHAGRPDPVDPNHNCAIGFDPAILPGALPGTLAGPSTAPAELGRAVAQARVCDDAFGLFGARVVHTGPGPEVVIRRILHEIDQVADEADARRLMLAVAMVQALLVELFVLVTRAGLDRQAQLVQGGPRRDDLQALLAWVGTRLDTPPTLDEMADRIGLSPAHLVVVCRRETGRTPLEQVTEMRVAEACRRLVGSSASVTAVAHDLGFCSSQYFSAVFRRHRGSTPSAWRAGRGDHTR
jgi:AraC-like DNA-binding protein